MKIITLDTDEQFIKLMPLVMAFSLKTGMPFYQHIKEVAESITNPNYLTQVGVDGEDSPVRYLCGYHVDHFTFMITQAFCQDDPSFSMLGYKIFEEELFRRGVRKIVMMTHLNPRVFRKYGFKFERFLLGKGLINEDKDSSE